MFRSTTTIVTIIRFAWFLIIKYLLKQKLRVSETSAKKYQNYFKSKVFENFSSFQPHMNNPKKSADELNCFLNLFYDK